VLISRWACDSIGATTGLVRFFGGEMDAHFDYGMQIISSPIVDTPAMAVR
jgi:hypothetical protein